MSQQKENLFQHFQPSDQALVAKFLDLVERLEAYYAPQLTDFLDPHQVAVARSVFGQAGVTYYVSSDYDQLEYARILLAPDYYQLDPADFELALVEIAYAQQFSQLTHAQILGSLLNGLGLKRQVIGDILVDKGYAQVVLAEPMVDFIISHTEKMARTGVRLKRLPFDRLIQPQEDKAERVLLLSSLRLDKLVAEVTGKSRSQAQEVIKAGRVKVNYRESLKPIQVLVPGDLVSIRGYGRLTITDLLGETKSGKQKVLIEEALKT